MAACLAAGPGAAQHGAPAGGEWRSYGGDSGEHEVLAAGRRRRLMDDWMNYLNGRRQ